MGFSILILISIWSGTLLVPKLSVSSDSSSVSSDICSVQFRNMLSPGGGGRGVQVGSSSAKIKDQPSANQ